MQIKIISDGTVYGTKVVNAETGEEIKGIGKVEWSVDAYAKSKLATAALHFVDVQVDVLASVEPKEKAVGNG